MATWSAANSPARGAFDHGAGLGAAEPAANLQFVTSMTIFAGTALRRQPSIRLEGKGQAARRTITHGAVRHSGLSSTSRRTVPRASRRFRQAARQEYICSGKRSGGRAGRIHPVNHHIATGSCGESAGRRRPGSGVASRLVGVVGAPQRAQKRWPLIIAGSPWLGEHAISPGAALLLASARRSRICRSGQAAGSAGWSVKAASSRGASAQAASSGSSKAKTGPVSLRPSRTSSRAGPKQRPHRGGQGRQDVPSTRSTGMSCTKTMAGRRARRPVPRADWRRGVLGQPVERVAGEADRDVVGVHCRASRTSARRAASARPLLGVRRACRRPRPVRARRRHRRNAR